MNIDFEKNIYFKNIGQCLIFGMQIKQETHNSNVIQSIDYGQFYMTILLYIPIGNTSYNCHA